MFSFFFPNKHDKAREVTQHPRNSSEKQSLSPLLDESGTNENRYYRSAEFQQALLEQEDERSSLFAHINSAEDAGRRSRYHRRNSTLVPKKPASHPTSPIEGDSTPRYLPDSSTEAETSPSAQDASESSSSTYSTSNTSLAAEVSHHEQPKDRPTRPRILTDGVSPQVAFAKNKKLE